jgi:hypothetical protein
MNPLTKTLSTVVTATVLTMSAFAQRASEVPGSSPLAPIKNEASDTNHRVYTEQTVTLTVPDTGSHSH